MTGTKVKSALPLCRTRLQIATLKRNRQLSSKDQKGPATCVTRAVELASTANEGEEKSKLLFLLALGLGPTPDKPTRGPFIRMERLKPEKEAKARALTQTRLSNVVEQRHKKLEMKPQKKLDCTDDRAKLGASSVDKHGLTEVIDLVSSDDEVDENIFNLGQQNLAVSVVLKPCRSVKKKMRDFRRKPRANTSAKLAIETLSKSVKLLSWGALRNSSTVSV